MQSDISFRDCLQREQEPHQRVRSKAPPGAKTRGAWLAWLVDYYGAELVARREFEPLPEHSYTLWRLERWLGLLAQGAA